MKKPEKKRYVEIDSLTLGDFAELQETLRFAARRDTSSQLFRRLLTAMDDAIHDTVGIRSMRLVLPKQEKQKRCRPGRHHWINVGTRTDSPLRCKNCPAWYGE